MRKRMLLVLFSCAAVVCSVTPFMGYLADRGYTLVAYSATAKKPFSIREYPRATHVRDFSKRYSWLPGPSGFCRLYTDDGSGFYPVEYSTFWARNKAHWSQLWGRLTF